MATTHPLAGDANFQQLLTFVGLHRAAILKQFEPADFYPALIDDRCSPCGWARSLPATTNARSHRPFAGIGVGVEEDRVHRCALT